MGKLKQHRFKIHFPAPQPEGSKRDSTLDTTSTDKPFTSLPINFRENVFEGLMISDLVKDVPKSDDTTSMKSYISNKSIKGEKAITKKEKFKLRREMFLKKIDTVNQFKKDKRLQKKKNLPIIGDTKPLFDSLPSLDSLFKLTDKPKSKQIKKPKKKAIEKSKKIQKDFIQNISIYKKLLKNPSLEKNPFEAISSHLKAVVEEERKRSNSI